MIHYLLTLSLLTVKWLSVKPGEGTLLLLGEHKHKHKQEF